MPETWICNVCCTDVFNNCKCLKDNSAISEHISAYMNREYGGGILLQPESKPSNPKDIIGSDKLPLSLVPGSTKAYLALGHLEGMLKYGYFNFREAGVRCSIYTDALERHLEKFKNGEWEDPITKVPHLANMLACLSIIVDAHECGKLTDDRPKSSPVASLIDRFAENVKHLKTLFSESKPVDYFITGPKKRE